MTTVAGVITGAYHGPFYLKAITLRQAQTPARRLAAPSSHFTPRRIPLSYQLMKTIPYKGNFGMARKRTSSLATPLWNYDGEFKIPPVK